MKNWIFTKRISRVYEPAVSKNQKIRKLLRDDSVSTYLNVRNAQVKLKVWISSTSIFLKNAIALIVGNIQIAFKKGQPNIWSTESQIYEIKKSIDHLYLFAQTAVSGYLDLALMDEIQSLFLNERWLQKHYGLSKGN